MKKILIVDDMMVSLMMTENMLADHYKTFCASSGEEAMKIYRQELPDMVLSDLRMPGMSGYELQTQLQEEYHEVIPFMFMTADHDEETESKGFDNGAMDFIRKPFRPDVLLRRVDNILQTVDQIKGLKKNASTDQLTGLLNKVSSQIELSKMCKKALGALMMIDLDSFKLVNDIHGHAMGDQVLINFADILRSAVRPTDILGRMGGDEFVAFCQGIHDEQTVAAKSKFINERIVEMAKRLMGEDMNIPLGASIGCAFVPMSGTDFAELYQKADKALYGVKQNGKHGYGIFNENEGEETAKVEIANLDQVEMVLNERNPDDGAFVLPFESFRTVYRFLKRTRGVYSKMTCLLVFSLVRHKEGEVNLKEVAEQFESVLHKTFRTGDAVTQNSNNQFLVLLTNADAYSSIKSAVQRVSDNWDKMEGCRYFTFNHEWKVLDK